MRYHQGPLLASLFLIFAAHALAQVPDSKVSVLWGPHLGYSSYTLFGSEVDFRKTTGATVVQRQGFEAGVDARVQLGNYFYISSGLNYAQKGGEIKGGGWANQTPVKNNYLVIPFLAGVSTNQKLRGIRFSVEGGWAYNIQLSTQHDYWKDFYPGLGVMTTTNQSIGSFIYGAEVAGDLSSRSLLFLTYRSSRDLQSFFYRESAQQYMHKELWNKGYSVSAGIRFRRRDQAGRDKVNHLVDTISRSFSWGLKAGMGVNTTAHSSAPGFIEDRTPMLSPHIGFYFDVKLAKRISFIPEVQYIQKGYNFRNDESMQMRLQLEYFEFPLVLSYKLSKRLNVDVGPVAGIFLDGKVIGFGTTTRDYNYHEVFETGLTGGMRYHFNNQVSLGCRYYRGLSNISSVSPPDPQPTEEHNVNWQLTGFFRL